MGWKNHTLRTRDNPSAKVRGATSRADAVQLGDA
jgi:hypothetical protein